MDLKNIKNIVAIASGKGGVGKSTVSVNLALSLQSHGAKVGILDADIYGPSIPALLGINNNDKPVVGNRFKPIKKYSLATLSIGYLISPKEAAIWRGPIVSSTLMQLLTQTDWPELDYLIIDLPPGTGDIQLTLAKKIPVTGVVVVTTPQLLATQIASKALAMFNKLGTPILGVIENMGSYECPSCGEQQQLCSTTGGAIIAKEYNVPLLGSIPLDFKIQNSSDEGIPIMVSPTTVEPDNKSLYSIRNKYLEIAASCLKQISQLQPNFSFPTPTKIQ